MAGDSGQTPSQPIVCRWSVLAVIAFALSLASAFLSAGATAIVLGIFVLRRIHRSGRMVRGRGLAKAAIVLSILMPSLDFLLLACVDIIPPEAQCKRHLHELSRAMLIYTNEHDGRLPAASKWCDLLLSVEGVGAGQFQCPGVRQRPWNVFYPRELFLYLRYQAARRLTGPCDYAMNEYATPRTGPPDLVLCFEAESGWNQVGGPEMLTTDHHGGRGCNVMFLDTHVEFIKTEDLGRLKWKSTP